MSVEDDLTQLRRRWEMHHDLKPHGQGSGCKEGCLACADDAALARVRDETEALETLVAAYAEFDDVIAMLSDARRVKYQALAAARSGKGRDDRSG